MEWVETTARSVDEAKELALDQLGVAEDDAEFEVLDEPKAGLFGRIRGEARVRARVRPTQARQKVDRRDRKRKKDDVAAEGSTTDVVPADTADAPSELKASRARAPRAPKVSAGAADVDSETTETPARPESRSVGDEARRFVEELVHAFGLTGTAELVEDGDDLEVQVHGTELGLLVGPKGSTLQAVQDLARVASQRRLGDHDTRLRVDIGGYRVRRREALGRFATQVAGEVTSSGTARALEPMSSSDRKIIHDTLSEMAGVSTRSEGDDPNRRVVIDPVSA
jgi:spoIIIJ-associated protein